MTVNELIAALSALPIEQRALPVAAHTGSWDQGSGPVTSLYFEDEPRDAPEHVVLCATDWLLCQPTIVEADQVTDQLAALRAEVEALRDEAGSRVTDPSDRPWDTRYATLTAVLDLIDKHAREDSDAKH